MTKGCEVEKHGAWGEAASTVGGTKAGGNEGGVVSRIQIRDTWQRRLDFIL